MADRQSSGESRLNEIPEQKRFVGALDKANKAKPSSPDLARQLKVGRHRAARLSNTLGMIPLKSRLQHRGMQDSRSKWSYLTVWLSPLFSADITEALSISTKSRTTLKISDPITGFGLPKTMLAKVDAICVQQDLTRSQVFRRSIMEYLKRPNVAINTDGSSPEQNPTWPAELFEHQRSRYTESIRRKTWEQIKRYQSGL